MPTRTFALLAGIAYLAVGILGFIPALLSPMPPGVPDLAVDTGYGRLLGLFPVNVLHNVVHLAIGVWALASTGSWGAARAFSRGLAVFYGILAVAGIIPGVNTLFGLAPLFSHDVWLHALTAILAAYFGWRTPEEIEARAGTTTEGGIPVERRGRPAA